MDRDEAKKGLWSTRNINTLSKVECNSILDAVYDDFESRTCENCKHYNNMCEYGITAPLFSEITYKDFGCNKFERKQ